MTESSGSRSRREETRGGSRLRGRLSLLVAILLAAPAFVAPMLCGTVHRPILLPLLGVVATLALATAALARTSQATLRPVRVLALPLVFLLIALVQLVPIPAGARALLDPAGSELLALAGLSGAQPLSLDPPETYRRFAEAAAAVAVGLAALMLTSGRRTRFVAPGLVASGGVASLVIGLGHRAVAEDRIYGLFPAGRGLLVGPFINPNHTAELLELAACTGLAFAFSRTSRDRRRLWLLLAAAMAAGALATLSRGSLLALAGAALTWFLLAPKSDEGEPFMRSRFASMLIGLLVVMGIALGLGAEKFAGMLLNTGGQNLTKVSVWLDSLKMVGMHPVGIGLGAFGHVYPVYQTIPSASWFEFVENQPLGILLEAGLPGLMLVAGASVVTLRHYRQNARRDRVEAALVAALVAVVVHNFTDFGLETPGVLLPFSAVLGALFGRQAEVREQPSATVAPTALAAIAAAAVVAGMALLSGKSARDFERLLAPPLPANARELAHAASRAHPTDYVFALSEARLAPPDLASASARMRMLNRAILLCPLCPSAHADAARELWGLGRHQQALLEWRTVLARSPQELWRIFDVMVKGGARPVELMGLATEQNRFELSQRLLAIGLIDAARKVLAASKAHENVKFHLVEAEIALAAKELPAARAAAQRALAVAPRDASAILLAAELDVREGDRDRALARLAEGLRYEPRDVALHRKQLALLMETDRWRAIDVALEEFRQALAESGAPMTEACIAAARIDGTRGQYGRALAEYQAAVALAPDNLGLQLDLGQAAEQAGSYTVASSVYDDILRKWPAQPQATAALDRIQKAKKALEVVGNSPFHTGADDH